MYLWPMRLPDRTLLTTAPTALQLAHALFDYLNANGVPYVVAGDVRDYADRISSDVDIVVAPNVLASIPARLNSFLGNHQAQLVQVIPHERTAITFICAWSGDRGNSRFLQVDVCSDFIHMGRLFLCAQELLTGRVTVPAISSGMHVPAPAPAFLYYLLKKVDKGELNDRQGDYLSTEWQKDDATVRRMLGRFLPPSSVGLVARAAATNQWSPVRAAMAELRLQLRRNRHFTPATWLLEQFHKLQRIRQPTGLMLAVLGSDGTGKSTTIARVAADLAPMFPRVRQYHLRPRLLHSDRTSGPVVQPHAQSHRGLPASMVKLAWWCTEYTIGYAFRVFPDLVRSSLVLFDRYYHDVLVDPVRYRYGAPAALARFTAHFIPRPDLTIVLTAPADVVHKRKQEVALAETARQQDAYVALATRLFNAYVVDAARPPDVVAADVEQIIVRHMHRRTAHRLTLDA